VVLVSAGLCVSSLRKLQAIDAGFEPAKVLAVSMDLALNGYREPRGRQFYSQLVERVSALPGVESVSLARIVPLGDGFESPSWSLVGEEKLNHQDTKAPMTKDYGR
jgi:hypothetical protein